MSGCLSDGLISRSLITGVSDADSGKDCETGEIYNIGARADLLVLDLVDHRSVTVFQYSVVSCNTKQSWLV